ncbi:XdhC family protein [Thalassotalea sp. Y01]|nr:XdhC family protein [Thalassotalea sp. Y01]
MQLTDIAVLEHANTLLSNNHSFWLCTITNTYGSAPRPIGSLFITDGVQRFGSISGGCLEDAFVDMLNDDYFNKCNQVFVYGEHGQQAASYAELPCGGRIQLLIEYIDANQIERDYFQQWLDLAHDQRPYQRTVHLDSQSRQLCAIDSNAPPLHSIEQIGDEIKLHYQEIFQLLLIGIGLVSEQIARLGLLSGFDVKVCDMRKELSNTWQFDKKHGGVDITWMSPDDFVSQYTTSNSAVLALAHDPRLDDVALMTVFESKAFYIGAMGSVRTTEKRLERLKRICGFNDQQLSRLNAPIGLHIGSKTPVEIAIATMADIIRVRHGVSKQEL